MDRESNVLRCATGVVTKFITPYKATIEFQHKGKKEKAILKRERFIVDGHFCTNEDFNSHRLLSIGSHVKFTAHNHDPTNPPPWADDGHNWYIIGGWCIEDEQKMLVKYNQGIVNTSVKVSKLSNKRQGTLIYEEENGKYYNILFLGSKVFLYGHRLNSKQPLNTQLYMDDELYCDAIPCDPEQNDSNCSWFATSVWRGHKPHTNDSDAKIIPSSPETMLRVMRALINNAKAVFVNGRGQVMSLVTEEFGLALLEIRPLQWKSVLFHRSVCFVKGFSLAKINLQNILKEGDPVRMVCVSTQGKHPFKFVACQLSVSWGGDDFQYLQI